MNHQCDIVPEKYILEIQLLKMNLQYSVLVYPMGIVFSYKFIFKEWFEQSRMCPEEKSE